ncbi:MAG: SDR family oxidoreductase [Deltaproteobacteria bacterium]|nr:SDR family oxidoreductase [Deltaproteobacteria bacterium]
MNIKDRVIIVTGGARRIGRAICLILAERGAKIVINYNRSENEAHELLTIINGINDGSAIAVKADVSNPEEVQNMIESTIDHFQAIDILVNNAAIFFKTKLFAISESDWDLFMNTNLKGPFLCSQKVGKIMSEKGSGKIINIVDSFVISKESRHYIPYMVSKAGLIMLTKTLASTLAPDIHVNAIAPGPVLFPDDLAEEEKRYAVEGTALKRIGSPEDIAMGVIFLIESEYITGEVLHINGGMFQ